MDNQKHSRPSNLVESAPHDYLKLLRLADATHQAAEDFKALAASDPEGQLSKLESSLAGCFEDISRIGYDVNGDIAALYRHLHRVIRRPSPKRVSRSTNANKERPAV